MCPISGIFQIIFIYIFIFFIYLISGAAVNVTSAGLFLATINSYLIKVISNYYKEWYSQMNNDNDDSWIKDFKW